MTNPIEEINQVTERVKQCLTGADLPEGQYALLVADAFRSLIAANELLQQQQDIIRSFEAKVEERDLWLNEVLNSDMAMREEDEGAISLILNEIRLLLGKQK